MSVIVDKRGISLKWFNNYVNTSLDNEQLSMMTTTELNPFVKELTKEKELSVVEYLVDVGKTEFVKDVADCFISHAWRYQLKQLIEALNSISSYSNGENDVFIWLDILCINQHKADRQEYPVEFWKNTFHQSISDIGKTISILQPWDNPIPLRRAWCIWELYGSTLNDETEM